MQSYTTEIEAYLQKIQQERFNKLYVQFDLKDEFIKEYVTGLSNEQMNHLPKNLRPLIQYRFCDELSLLEIAKELELPIKVAKEKIQKVRNHLFNLIQKDHTNN